jgi:hypothetical protein
MIFISATIHLNAVVREREYARMIVGRVAFQVMARVCIAIAPLTIRTSSCITAIDNCRTPTGTVAITVND